MTKHTSTMTGSPVEPIHDSDERFVEYYSEASTTAETQARFEAVRDRIVGILRSEQGHSGIVDVADIGCGTAGQAMIWALDGHRVRGLDVNRALIEVGRERASEVGAKMQLEVGTASELPWADSSLDVCLLLELLEHIPEWQPCLDEIARVLRPGGVLYLSTSNKLCPRQDEFDLPLYSWYPRPLKRYFERLAVTTRPELVNYATYPAVNWFSYYQLRNELADRGFTCRDRVDFMDASQGSPVLQLATKVVKALPPLRWLVQLATSNTVVVAVKQP